MPLPPIQPADAVYPPDAAALSRFFAEQGLQPRTLGRTLFGLPLLAVRLGRHDGRKPVLITAGAHAEEAAGVASALDIIRRYDGDWPLVVMSCRDPLGWEGVRSGLRRALGEPQLSIDDHTGLLAALRARTTPLLDDGVQILARIGEIAIFALDPEHEGAEDTGEYAAAYLAERPELCRQLLGVRVLVPGSPRFTQHRDIYGWGGSPTLFIDEQGRLANFNRFFSSQDAPVEVAVIRALVDELEPCLLFDLHEGFGYEYCLYANGAPEPTRQIAEAMVAAVRARNHPIMTRATLAAFTARQADELGEVVEGAYGGRPTDEIARDKRLDALGLYVRRHGACAFTTEMGMEAPLEVRYEMTCASAWAGLQQALSYLRSDAGK